MAVAQVAQDYGYSQASISRTLATIGRSSGTGGALLLSEIKNDPDLLGLCVHSFEQPQEESAGFVATTEERIAAVLAAHNSSNSSRTWATVGGSGGGGAKLGFVWTVIVEVPMFQRYGRVTFSADATFPVIRAALAEFVSSCWADEGKRCDIAVTVAGSASGSTASSFGSSLDISATLFSFLGAPAPAASLLPTSRLYHSHSSSPTPSLIDDGSLLISLLDDGGWSREMAAGSFAETAAAALSAQLLQQRRARRPLGLTAAMAKMGLGLGLGLASGAGSGSGTGNSDAPAPTLTVTARSARDPFGGRQLLSEVRAALPARARVSSRSLPVLCPFSVKSDPPSLLPSLPPSLSPS